MTSPAPDTLALRVQVIETADRYLAAVGLPTYASLVDEVGRGAGIDIAEIRSLRLAHLTLAGELDEVAILLVRGDVSGALDLLDEAMALARHYGDGVSAALPPGVVSLACVRMQRTACDLTGGRL